MQIQILDTGARSQKNCYPSHQLYPEIHHYPLTTFAPARFGLRPV